MTLTHQAAVNEAVRTARREHDRYGITADEQARIIEQLRINPLPMVRRDTGRSYTTLARIAEVAGL